MSLETYVGPEGNLLDVGPEQCHRLLLKSPILTIEEMNALKNIHVAQQDWSTKVIDLTFPKSEGLPGYQAALMRVREEASKAIDDGFKIVILSDRAVGPDRISLSAILACGGVHHFLVSQKKRAKVALMVETGEAREVHHREPCPPSVRGPADICAIQSACSSATARTLSARTWSWRSSSRSLGRDCTPPRPSFLPCDGSLTSIPVSREIRPPMSCSITTDTRP